MGLRTLLFGALGFLVMSALWARPASAALEFCPGRVSAMQATQLPAQSYAFRIQAPSERRITGAVLIESDAGWYEIRIKPVALTKSAEGFASPLLIAQFPKPLSIANYWLAEAASDAPGWADKGVVDCAPLPSRVKPRIGSVADPSAAVITAQAIAAPFTWNCVKPFAEAVAETSAAGTPPDLEPGATAAVAIELDARGKAIDIMPIDASNGYMEWGWQLRQYAKTLQYKPAMAYCRPVPSTYVLRLRAQP